MPDTFEPFAVRYMRALVAERDFGFSEQDAAAIVGNLGHESAGFRLMQEAHPRSGRGGLGAAQWTGTRRVAFERWLNGRPASDFDASLTFLCHELRTSENRAVARTKGASGLRAKVVAFELGFERAAADAKHYDSRLRYAQRALAAYRAADAQPDPALERIADIRRLQARLTELGLGRIVGRVDGDAGPLTHEAVRAFQLCRGGLAADGIAGPLTRAALGLADK